MIQAALCKYFIFGAHCQSGGNIINHRASGQQLNIIDMPGYKRAMDSMERSGFYIEVTEGRGRDLIRARVLKMGEHILIVVGGCREHIGAAVLAEPARSLSDKKKITSSASVITRLSHKEYQIAREIAMSLASFLNQPVLVCCGIHFENIKRTEIINIEKNIDSLISKLKMKLGRNS